MFKLIEKLEQALDTNILLIASASRPDIAVDLNELAARYVRGLCQEGEKYTILLFGGGGELGFADSIKRSLGEYEVLIGDRISGSFVLLALCSSKMKMSKHAAIGAFDSGLFWTPPSMIDALVYDDIPALGGLNTEHDPTMPGRVAQVKSFRRRANVWLENNAPEFDRDALTCFKLGLDTGLSSEQIADLGLSSALFHGNTLREIMKHLDLELGNTALPLSRYSESDLADEVEFEFASEVPGAFISTSKAGFVYLLDTGNPHPDSGRYVGGWTPIPEQR